MIREYTRAIWLSGREKIYRAVCAILCAFITSGIRTIDFGSNQLRGALDKSTFLNVSAATSSFLVMEMTAKPSVCKTQLLGCNCIGE